MDVFFPSCNFTRLFPDAAKKLRVFMKDRMPVAGCCQTDTRDFIEAFGSSDAADAEGTPSPDASVRGLYICQSCRGYLDMRELAGLTPVDTESLWPWLDALEGVEWPRYDGLAVVIQDCWRDREHPEVHQAVRSLLSRMGVTWIDAPDARDEASFCGTIHAVPRTPATEEELSHYPSTRIGKLPPELRQTLMHEQVENLDSVSPEPDPWILTYCNRCTLGILEGGGQAVHLAELLMGTFDPDARPQVVERIENLPAFANPRNGWTKQLA